MSQNFPPKKTQHLLCWEKTGTETKMKVPFTGDGDSGFRCVCHIHVTSWSSCARSSEKKTIHCCGCCFFGYPCNSKKKTEKTTGRYSHTKNLQLFQGFTVNGLSFCESWRRMNRSSCANMQANDNGALFKMTSNGNGTLNEQTTNMLMCSGKLLVLVPFNSITPSHLHSSFIMESCRLPHETLRLWSIRPNKSASPFKHDSVWELLLPPPLRKLMCSPIFRQCIT